MNFRILREPYVWFVTSLVFLMFCLKNCDPGTSDPAHEEMMFKLRTERLIAEKCK